MFGNYSFHPPKFFRDSKVAFLDHAGNERIGTIQDVQTNYDALNIAYHTYTLNVEGNLNRFKILEVKIQYSIS